MSFLLDQNIKVLALDIDGTLYPKRMLNARMLATSFPSLRLALSFNKARKEYRRIQDQDPPSENTRFGLLEKQASLVCRYMSCPIDAQSVKRMMDRINKQFYRAWERSFLSIKPYKGMREALIQAKESGMKIAVFSDFPLSEKLKTLKIDDLVDFALSSEDSGYLKPSKKAFSFLLAHLEEDPQQVLYVGDSYDKDCQGAKHAGMYACLLTEGRRDGYSDADLIVGSWKEFSSLVL